MQENHRLALRVAGKFPVDMVEGIDLKKAFVVGLYWWKKIALHPCLACLACLDGLRPARLAGWRSAYRPVLGIARAAARSALLLLAVLLSNPASLQAQSLPEGLSEPTWGRVVEVVDGDTVRLENGREVRFVGLQAPKLPLGRANFSTWPLAPEAKSAVEALLLGREVGLAYAEDGRREDRYGRILAQLVTREGVWIQGRLLELGLARVYSFPDNRALAPEMLTLERAARRAGRGIWDHPFYRIREARAGALWPLLDSFQLVEGEVREVFSSSRNTYLNFGEDWREDFSLQIPRAVRDDFRGQGVELDSLAGRRVRVRGWISAYNGPLIRISHPEQIELLEP